MMRSVQLCAPLLSLTLVASAALSQESEADTQRLEEAQVVLELFLLKKLIVETL